MCKLCRSSFSLKLGLEQAGQVLAAGFELLATQAQPVGEDTGHEGMFLFYGVVLAALEEKPLIGALQRPCAHSEAKFNIRLDFPGMGGAVE